MKKLIFPISLLACLFLGFIIGFMSITKDKLSDRLGLHFEVQKTIKNVNMTFDKMNQKSKDEELQIEFEVLKSNFENSFSKDSSPQKVRSYLEEYNQKLLSISINKKQD